MVKKHFKGEIIVPGIRLKDDDKQDQRRVFSPKEIYNKKNCSIVMGRSLTKGSIKKNLLRLIQELK